VLNLRGQYVSVCPPLFNSGRATLIGREGLWLVDAEAEGLSARRGRWNESHHVAEEPKTPTY